MSALAVGMVMVLVGSAVVITLLIFLAFHADTAIDAMIRVTVLVVAVVLLDVGSKVWSFAFTELPSLSSYPCS